MRGQAQLAQAAPVVVAKLLPLPEVSSGVCPWDTGFPSGQAVTQATLQGSPLTASKPLNSQSRIGGLQKQANLGSNPGFATN